MKPRYDIPFRGLKEGDHGFEWRVDDGFWKNHPEGGITGGEIEVAAVLEKGATGGRGGEMGATGAMRLEVTITGSVTVPCDRCLEDCSLPVDYQGRLTVKMLADAAEQPFDGEVLWLAPGEVTIDLEQYIYESIVLSLPLQRVHPEDVHGQPLCNPAMLERFKIVTEDEFEDLTTK